MSNPSFRKHIGKLANLRLLQKLAKQSDGGWYFNKIDQTFSYTFKTLHNCTADNPPQIRLEITVDKDHRVLDVVAKVQIFKFQPPGVGFFNNTKQTPVGMDKAHVEQTLLAVLDQDALPAEHDVKSAAKVARQAKA